MANRKYTILANRAYDTDKDGVVTLDASDPLVQANIDAGVITLATGQDDDTSSTMLCPACEEAGMKRPPKLSSQHEVDEHYDEKHPALAVPAFTEEGAAD